MVHHSGSPRNTLYNYTGHLNNHDLRYAIQICQEVKEECAVPNVTFVDDGYEKTLAENAKKAFNIHLPLEKRIVLPENGLDGETLANGPIKLYRCTEITGKYRVTEIKSGPLLQTDLNSDVNGYEDYSFFSV